MDKQEIVAKYTKLLTKELYNLDNIDVVFDDYLCEHGEDIRAKCWLGMNNTIYFHGKIFEKDALPPHAWVTMVHEITHYEEGISVTKETWEYYHSDKFKELLRKNFDKVKELRKEFDNEVQWTEDYDFNDIDEHDIRDPDDKEEEFI